MKSKFLALLLLCSLILASCNAAGETPTPTLDINALNTSVVGTTIAQAYDQYTQTALAVSLIDTSTSIPSTQAPTDAALPTFSLESPTSSVIVTPLSGLPTTVATSALGDSCNNSAFEGDVTIPDGSILKPGEDFQKIWKLRNTGTCRWDEGYTLVYIGGSTPDLDPYSFEFEKSSDFVAGGEAINIAINLTAPLTQGKYEGHWRMRNDSGYYFGTILSVYVEVKGTTPSYP